ncbi:MAG: DUF5689 domain-containing protein [Paludibacter sp.]|nr:DUF5689 domain-containing protein [Paludibacter sp.]
MKEIKFMVFMLFAFTMAFTGCTNVNDPEENSNEETVIYSENFGTELSTTTPTDGWLSVGNYTQYQKNGKGASAVTYSSDGGAVTLRGNQPSSGYTGASGSANAMAAAGGASLVIKNIATCGAKNLVLSFGSIVVSDTLSVSYRISGTTDWIPVVYSKDVSGWGLVENLEITLPTGTNTINLKFTAAKTQYGTRVDDIKIVTKDATTAAVVDPDNGDVSNATEISIADVRAMNSDVAKTTSVTIPDEKKIVGIVVSDGVNLNSYSTNLQLVSLDNSAGIMVRFDSDHSFSLGDKVEIVVSGQSLEFYKKLLQINNVPLSNATKISSANTVTPTTATIAQITANMDAYESRLVKIENATITNTSNTYSGNSTINDGTGEIILYTRSQATFATTSLPVSAQNITAFVTRYDDTKQISIRNLDDVVSGNPNLPVLQITSANSASANVNEQFSHTFISQEANLTGTTVISCDNLPSWLSINGMTISGTTPTTEETFALNIVATNGIITANQTFTITVKAPTAAGVNLLTNGSFEDFSGVVPTSWNIGTSPNNLPVEKITTDAQNGSIAVKMAGDANGRCDLKQAVSGIEAGKTYVVSFWYKDNLKSASSSGIRIWSSFTKAGSNISASGADWASALQPSATYEAVSVWTKYEVEVVAPADADGFNFEIRATKSNYGTVDNCSLSLK